MNSNQPGLSMDQAAAACRKLGEALEESARQLQKQAREDGRLAFLAGLPRRARGDFDDEDFGMRSAWLAGWDAEERARRERKS